MMCGTGVYCAVLGLSCGHALVYMHLCVVVHCGWLMETKRILANKTIPVALLVSCGDVVDWLLDVFARLRRTYMSSMPKEASLNASRRTPTNG